MINARYVDWLESRIRELNKKLSDEADAALHFIAENKSLKAERGALLDELQKANAVIIDLQRNPPKYTERHLAEIRAEAIEQSATYLSESIPGQSHKSVIIEGGYVYISTRYLREHAETIRQGGAE